MSDREPGGDGSGGPPRPAAVRVPDEAVRRRVRAALEAAGAPAALAFVEAVVAQAAVPLGQAPPPGGRVALEARVADTVLELLLGGGEVGAAARRLRADPPLLAAFFQNVDLLYRDGWDGADRVSALVMAALEEP